LLLSTVIEDADILNLQTFQFKRPFDLESHA